MQNYKEIFKRHRTIQKQIAEIDNSIKNLKSKQAKLKEKLNHGKEEGQYPSRRRDLKQLG